MTLLLLLLFAHASSLPVPVLPVAERCSLVRVILNADLGWEWERGSNMTKIIRKSFVEMEPDDVPKTRGRFLVRPRWLIKGKHHDLFAEGETCNDEEFVLESEQTREEIGEAGDIIVVTLARIARSDRFKFEESYALYGPRGPGYFSVPGLRYEGTVERGSDGEWTATATRRFFRFIYSSVPQPPPSP